MAASVTHQPHLRAIVDLGSVMSTCSPEDYREVETQNARYAIKVDR